MTLNTNNNDQVNGTTRTPDMDIDEPIQRDSNSEPKEVAKKVDFHIKENQPKSGGETEGRDAQSNPSHTDLQAKLSQLEMRISHLGCLVDFVNENLAGLIELRDDVKSGKLEKITFGDLWNLFKPGDLVLSNRRGREQLHRVHFVTGGRLMSRTLSSNGWRAEIPVDTWTEFKVDTYMMAFDGDQVGPVGESWGINHYLGERLVTGLPIYPAQLHPNPESLLARMDARGRKFMKSIGHKHYEGLGEKQTRGRTRKQLLRIVEDDDSSDDDDMKPGKTSQEYITSEVFVDFKAYREVDKYYTFNLGKLVRSKVFDQGAVNRYPPGSAMHSNEDIFSGPEIDTKLGEDYMTQSRGFLEPFKFTDAELSAEYYQILPSEVPGYTFRYRMWCMVPHYPI